MRCVVIRVVLQMLVGVGCMVSSNSVSAQLGASGGQLSKLLGNPVKQSGDFLYYHKAPNNIVAHFHKGACDQICIFSDSENQGLPVAMTDNELQVHLRDFGGGMTWAPLERFSMNRLWNSGDGKCFAIYETMYHKLVLMTRVAYRREKGARP